MNTIPNFEEFTITDNQAAYAKRMQAKAVATSKRDTNKRAKNGANRKRTRIAELNNAELSQH